MKKIILFIDGEWDGAQCGERSTNLGRMAQFLAPEDDQGRPQISYYRDTSARVRSQEFLEKDLADAYRFIVQNYQAGDQIALFGFSYGAFLVRLLSGLIDTCGILQRHHWDKVDAAIALLWQVQSDTDSDGGRQFRSHYAVSEETEIHMLGLFDSVGEAGIPIRFLGHYHENTVLFEENAAQCVRFGYHALAYEETRADYSAATWQPTPGVTLRHRWFAGSHRQLGGIESVSPGDGCLGDIALNWMLDCACEHNIEFDAGIYAGLNPGHLAPYQSGGAGFSRFFGVGRREVEEGHEMDGSLTHRLEVLGDFNS